MRISVKPGYWLAVVFFLLLPSHASGQAGQRDAAEYRSYLAHIAAAGQALRLNDTAEALRWLTQAPARFRGWEWRYLNAQASQHAASFDLKGPQTALALSPDGSLVASAGSDRLVRLTVAATGEEVFRFSDPKLMPLSLAFSPDGKSLAAAFSGHTVIAWDVAARKETRRFQGQGKGLTGVAFSPDGRWLAACSWNRTPERGVWGIVEVWDAVSGAPVKQLEYGTKPLVAIAFSPNGKHLAVASWEVDKMAAIWEVATWQGPEVLPTPDEGVYKAAQTIAFSADSTLLAAGGKDSTTYIWTVDSRQLVHRLGGRGWGHSKWVNSIAFSPDGRSLASASTDQTVRLWDVKTGGETSVLRGHVTGVNSVSFSPDGAKIYSASGDGTIKTWDRAGAGDRVWRLDGSAYGIAFSPDGQQAVSAHWLGKLRIWDLAAGRIAREWTGHVSSANSAAFSSDGKRLASVGNDGKVKMWDAASAAELRVLDTVKGVQLVSVAVTPEGKVLSAASAGEAKLWDAEADAAVLALSHKDAVTYVALSRDGRVAATGGADGSLKLWSLPGGNNLATLTGLRSRISCLAFGPKGTVAAAAGRTVALFDRRTQKELRRLDGHQEAVTGVAFSPDGSRLVTTSLDQTLKIWDAATGEAILTIPFSAGLWNAIFHPDGRRLFVLPLDDTIRVLEAPPPTPGPGSAAPSRRTR